MATEQQRCAGGIPYTLARRRVRNINLRVRPDGSVVAMIEACEREFGGIDGFFANAATWVGPTPR